MPVLVIADNPIARLAVLFLVLLHATISCALGVWFVTGQRHYIRAYRRVHRLTVEDLPLSDELDTRELYLPEWRRQAAFLNAYFTPQADDALERKRRRTFWRIGLTLAYWLIGGIALLAIIS